MVVNKKNTLAILTEVVLFDNTIYNIQMLQETSRVIKKILNILAYITK